MKLRVDYQNDLMISFDQVYWYYWMSRTDGRCVFAPKEHIATGVYFL